MKFENIVSDWQKQFPILSQYTSSTLYAKADIILIGLRLDKIMSNTYLRISLQWYRHSGELVLRGVGAWYRI